MSGTLIDLIFLLRQANNTLAICKGTSESAEMERLAMRQKIDDGLSSVITVHRKFPEAGHQVNVQEWLAGREKTPKPVMCGGCGAMSDSERCIGCLHDFGTPESSWVRNRR